MTSIPELCTAESCQNPPAPGRKGLCWEHYGKDWRRRNPDKAKRANQNHYTKNGDTIREKARVRMSKYYQENKDKRNAYHASWESANPEKVAENKRASQSRRRARAKGSGVEYYTEKDILNLYGTTCHICTKQIDMEAPRRCGDPGWEMSFWRDHLIPIALGGPDILSNVRPSHGLCNLRKGVKPCGPCPSY